MEPKKVDAESFQKLETFKVVKLDKFIDERGALTVIDSSNFDFFTIKRIFFVYDVPNTKVRGEHAHLSCWQFILANAGSLNVSVDNGIHKREYLLNSLDFGLLIPPMHWTITSNFTKETVLVVLASESYDSTDYVRDYAEFLKLSQ